MLRRHRSAKLSASCHKVSPALLTQRCSNDRFAEAVLFNESIAYNIGYGKENSTQEEIEDAAKAAKIYDKIVGFPDQWETKVGERGVRLSGGEKQRGIVLSAIR